MCKIHAVRPDITYLSQNRPFYAKLYSEHDERCDALQHIIVRAPEIRALVPSPCMNSYSVPSTLRQNVPH